MTETAAAAAAAEVDPERVRVEVRDGIADVRLVRADKHNALDLRMFQALDAAIRELATATGVRAVVLSGDGPSFCSGLDFPSFMAAGQDIAETLLARRDGDVANLAQRITYDWLRLPVPVIAALHGNCLGGGAQLALAADIRVADPATRFSVLEIKYGLVPDMGITRSLPRLVGIDVAKELVWTGRFVTGDELSELGLATHLTANPHAAAMELAAEIASKSPDAIRAGKRLLEEAWHADARTSLALEEELQLGLLGTPNQIAAVQAAMTGEPPKFEDPGA